MGLRDRLNELDQRAGLRRPPGAGPYVVRPLSPVWVNVVRAACAISAVALALVLLTGTRWLMVLVSSPLLQIPVMKPLHRRQIFVGPAAPEGRTATAPQLASCWGVPEATNRATTAKVATRTKAGRSQMAGSDSRTVT